MEILIVDDDKLARMLFRAILEKTPNCSVSEAEDGQAAWDMLANGLTTDLIVSDITMPRLSGIELLKRLRADDRFKTVHIIMATAVKDRATIEEVSRLGTDYYLLKPFSEDRVLDQLQRVARELAKRSPLQDPIATQKRLGIDEMTYFKFLWMLGEEVKSTLQFVAEDVTKTQWAEAEYRLNSISGAALNLGLPDLTQAILSTELAIKASDADRVALCLRRVEWENHRLTSALPNQKWTENSQVTATH